MKRILSIVLCLAMVVGFFAFGVSAETTTYQKVTSLSELAANDSIVIVTKYNNNYYAMPPAVASKRIDAVQVTISGNSISAGNGSSISTWTVASVGNNTISLKTGNNYLGNSNGDLTANTTAASWTVATTSGAFKLTGGSSRMLALNWNNGNPRFKAYAASNDGTSNYSFALEFYKVGSSSDDSGNQGGGSVTPPVTPPANAANIPNGTYVISTDGKALTALSSNYGYLQKTDVTVDGTTVSGYVNENLFTITNTSNGQFTIQDCNDKYLYMSGTYNNFNVSTTAQSDGSDQWIAIEDNGAYIIKNVLKEKTLAWSIQYSSFGAYADVSDASQYVSAFKFTAATSVVVTTEQYGMLNNISHLDLSKKIVIMNKDLTVAMGASAGNFFNQIADITNNTTGNAYANVPSTAIKLTVEAVAGGYKFKTADNKYLYAVSGNNYLKVTDDVNAASVWTITINPDGEAIIKTTAGEEERYLQYNSNNTRFSAYQLSSNQANGAIVMEGYTGDPILVCTCDDSQLTWKSEGNQHWQECACGNRPITKCSTELETKYNDNKHWDECPDCDFATAQLDHAMAPQKDATHHWTACACGKATDKVEHDLEYKSDATHHWQECKDCDHSTETTKEAHNFGTEYKKDAANHYLECVCGKQSDKGAHNDGDDADKLCDKCGLDMSCTHANGYEWTHDATSHWEKCKDCGVEKAGTKAAHTLDGKKDADNHWSECTNTNCGYATEKVAHTMDPQKDATHHWDACSCGQATEKVKHTMEPQKNDTHHWTECNCGHASEKVEHTLVGGKCECGYSNVDSIKDSLAGEKGDTFTVTGVVNLIDGKNVYIQDGTGGICIYLSAAPEGLKLGDTITATGKRDTYNGLPELVKATYEKVADSSLELKPAEKTVDSLTAADVGTYVTLKDLTVVEVFDNDGAYSTPNITVKDAKGNEIQIYKAQIAKVGEAWSVKVGDKITVTASVGIYKETLQLRNTVAGEIVVTSANSATGDIFGVFVAMMAVSGMGLTVVLKKKH